MKFQLVFLLFVFFVPVQLMSEDFPKLGERLTREQVAQFANLALANLDREYPNKPSNVMTGPDTVRSPKDLHPAFYGCFDWHSSVHGHWMLIRLIKQYPKAPIGKQIRKKLNEHLSAENMRAETAYFDSKENKSFERMYGWAWALRLAAELHDWDDEDGIKWKKNFAPLEKTIVELTKNYLPRLSYPIRTGVHPDTAFAFGQVLDYARTVGDKELEKLVIKRSKQFYAQDREYPVNYEPSGEDFFSAGLNEADLMRRVLSPTEFSAWLNDFLPELSEGRAGNLLKPVEVSDVTDGRLVHLAGLDLSRAWTLQGIASVLPDDSRKKVLMDSANAHAKVGLGYVFSGHYEGDHWLATFAIYAMDQVGATNLSR